MLAGIRQTAGGLAMVMAGFLVVALAQLMWATLAFDPWSSTILLGNQAHVMGGRANTFAVFAGHKPWPFIGTPLDAPRFWTGVYAFGQYGVEAIVGVIVVIWLIGYAIRRVASSMSSGRPA